ncbi:MAG: hypothetical protein ACOCWD_07510 [Tangfeifania sp.]
MEERLERCEEIKKEYQIQNFNLSQENIRLKRGVTMFIEKRTCPNCRSEVLFESYLFDCRTDEPSLLGECKHCKTKLELPVSDIEFAKNAIER